MSKPETGMQPTISETVSEVRSIISEMDSDERDALTAELSDSALEEVAGGAGVTPLTVNRGGWDGNHIQTMRRSTGRQPPSHHPDASGRVVSSSFPAMSAATVVSAKSS